MTGEQSAMVAQPGDGALDDPALAVAAQGTSVLGDGVCSAIGAMRRDHLDAQNWGRELGSVRAYVQNVAGSPVNRDQRIGIQRALRIGYEAA